MSNSPKPTPGPSLETLLRLKRSERPDTEFWQEFDRGLRHKQLAAIVAPKPWWLGLSLLVRRVPAAAWSVPAGAAAALLAVLSLSSGPIAGTASVAPEIQPTVAATEPAPVRVSSPAADIDSALESVQPATVTPPATLLASATAPADTTPATAADLPLTVEQVPAASPGMLANAALGPLVAELPTATRSMDGLNDYTSFANAAVEWPAPARSAARIETTRNLLLAAVETTPVLDATPAVDESEAAELAQLANPRHARLLAAPLVPDETENLLAHARERVVHSLANGEELYASVTRLGVRGDRLSVSF